MQDERTFESELEDIINKYSKEQGSDTPDFILAEYLAGCLAIWNSTIKRRQDWWGFKANGKPCEESEHKPLPITMAQILSMARNQPPNA